DLARDGHRFFGDLSRAELGIVRERTCGREREGPARSNRDNPIVWLDEVAGPGEQKRGGRVEHDEHGLEPAENAIAAPVLRELDGGALEIPAVLLEFGLEAGEERERVGGRARKPGEHPIVIQTPDLPGTLL